MTEILDAMTAPDANGHIHAKRVASKGLLPSTWLNRTLRVEYVDASGRAVETSGTLLDLFPCGPILNLSGAKTCLSQDAVRVVELVED